MKPELKTREEVVDLDCIIANSNNKLLKSFPRFLINIMKGIICQDQLNAMHKKHYQKMGIDYVDATLSELKIDIRMFNAEGIDPAGRYIFVANHPLGGVDALALLSCIHKICGKVISPSNELFNYVPNLQPLIVGVNVFGKNNREKSQAISKVFESDCAIMIFPAGKVSRKFNGTIRDLEWHKSFISKAVQTKRDVVPVFISGHNSGKFYRIARFRKFLGIKMTIETLFLPQEMFRKKGTSVDLVFGKPVSYTFFDKSKEPTEWAQYIKALVYDMGKTHLGN